MFRKPQETSRPNVLYLAPWVDIGGTDKGTVDWFRWLDPARFRASLTTTQPSPNRRLHEVVPYAEEVWPLPDLMPGRLFPNFIADFIESRRVDVVHLMNSRLGYDLLPDLTCLPVPPAVVVQLHVEEEDRSGYVRYVTTRYGNLVDAFSVTSRHLAEVVAGYDVSPAAIHVIPTGVDARHEFSPGRVGSPVELERGPVHVLFLGRLVEQKDPLLSIEVAARLRAETSRDFRLHLVGEGQLEGEVRAAVRRHRLEPVVRLHPATTDPAAWYAAADVVLMTSTYEGVPYVAYEALAMGVPMVAPSLPGNVELMDEVGGALVDGRDPADFVRPLRELVEDASARARIGADVRRRMLDGFSLERMASDHGALYERLLAGRRRGGDREPPVLPPGPELAPVRFRSRPSRDRPLVSVIVACYNHGRFLPGVLDSIGAQTYGRVETIVVDDASSEPDTHDALDAAARRPRVRVVRQAENRGPSAARNAGIELARGRYVLPLDADNQLLPDAIEELVAQLSVAGETVGFIYPNQQFFGNRGDYFAAPAYNLATLIESNYCDTCSLIDSEVFAAGVRYPEDVRFGHEDWDFVLALAERGIHGEPARGASVLVRKHGFSRADQVEHGPRAFASLLPERHPLLYGREDEDEPADRDLGPRVSVRAGWAPAASLILLPTLEGSREEVARLDALLRAQSCRDAEAIVRTERPIESHVRAPRLRRVPSELGAGDPAAALAQTVAAARGRILLASELDAELLLADRSLIEKVLRVFAGNDALGALALVDAGERHFPFQLLEPGAVERLPAHTVIWTAGVEHGSPYPLGARSGAPADSLARMLAPVVRTQWRHLDGGRTARRSADEGALTSLEVRPPRSAAERGELRARAALEPLLPGISSGSIRRWEYAVGWTPPETVHLCRHRRLGADERVVTNSRVPPAGFALDYDLGSIQRFPKRGTAPLVLGHDGQPVDPDDEDRHGPPSSLAPDRPRLAPGEARVLGHLERVAFPLLHALEAAWHPASGQHLLVAGPSDPLMGWVEGRRTLGFIEPFPIEPRYPPDHEYEVGVRPLLRAVDHVRRRHVYGTDPKLAGDLVGELGALMSGARPGLVPLTVTADGLVVAEGREPRLGRPAASVAARWTLAPLAWRGDWQLPSRARAAARRGAETARGVVRPRRRGLDGDRAERELLGFLLPEPAADRVPLYSAMHPVNGDQLLTRSERRAAEMGYGQVVLLGYLLARAPITGNLGVRRVPVAWASRFGLAAGAD